MKFQETAPRWLLLGLGLLLAVSLAAAQANPAAQAAAAKDQQLQAEVQQKIAKKKDMSQVHVQVEDRVAKLSGSVPDLRAKLEAAHQARGVDGVDGVVNQIEVHTESVPDEQLKREIADRLTYDRMGMGQTFNALTVGVHNGVVTVGGQVRDYPDRDSAVDIIVDTKGVKGVIDNIEVAPLSPMDDQIRLAAARAIYGNPSMIRYANDPAHPIRILVENGRVTLVGVVDSQVDKSVAGNAVRGLPGVLGVKNDLVVAGGQ
jgi:osmotically-inducible protein OsmY